MEYTEGMPTVVHPHITSDPNICGGSPCIEGTRITVRTIAIYALHHGQTPEELLTILTSVSHRFMMHCPITTTIVPSLIRTSPSICQPRKLIPGRNPTAPSFLMSLVA